MAKTQVSVSEDSKKALDRYAKKYDIAVSDAADRMLGVAVSRLNALARYAEAQKGGAKPKAPKGRLAKIKTAAKKTGKAKASKPGIGRKAKATKEAEAQAA